MKKVLEQHNGRWFSLLENRADYSLDNALRRIKTVTGQAAFRIELGGVSWTGAAIYQYEPGDPGYERMQPVKNNPPFEAGV